MVDTHCHLYEAGDIEAELARFKAAGGGALVCAGAGIESSKRAIELAGKYPEVWATVGVHPESLTPEFSNLQLSITNELLNLIKNEKVVAVGECGLDYAEGMQDTPPRSPSGHLGGEDGNRGENRDRQKELFRINVEAARETGLPLVVHCRNAFEDIWERVKNAGVVGQMHCWTGNEEWMKKFVEAGWYISFGGILTFKNSRDLREVAGKVPEDKLLVETDAPYLAPEPVRGSKNTPANVKYVVACLAEIRGLSIQSMSKITSENTRRLFERMT